MADYFQGLRERILSKSREFTYLQVEGQFNRSLLSPASPIVREDLNDVAFRVTYSYRQPISEHLRLRWTGYFAANPFRFESISSLKKDQLSAAGLPDNIGAVEGFLTSTRIYGFQAGGEFSLQIRLFDNKLLIRAPIVGLAYGVRELESTAEASSAVFESKECKPSDRYCKPGQDISNPATTARTDPQRAESHSIAYRIATAVRWEPIQLISLGVEFGFTNISLDDKRAAFSGRLQGILTLPVTERFHLVASQTLEVGVPLKADPVVTLNAVTNLGLRLVFP